MNREQIYKAALEEIEKQARLHVRVGGRPIWLADIMRSARAALEAAAKVGDEAADAYAFLRSRGWHGAADELDAYLRGAR